MRPWVRFSAAPGTARARAGAPGASWCAARSQRHAQRAARRRAKRTIRKTIAIAMTRISISEPEAERRVPAEDQAQRPVEPGLRDHRAGGRHQQHRQHRIMEADVVIGVRAGRDDGDDLAVAGRSAAGDRRGDELMVGLAEPASPSSRRAAAAERAAAAAVKPPPPPPNRRRSRRRRAAAPAAAARPAPAPHSRTPDRAAA